VVRRSGGAASHPAELFGLLGPKRTDSQPPCNRLILGFLSGSFLAATTRFLEHLRSETTCRQVLAQKKSRCNDRELLVHPGGFEHPTFSFVVMRAARGSGSNCADSPEGHRQISAVSRGIFKSATSTLARGDCLQVDTSSGIFFFRSVLRRNILAPGASRQPSSRSRTRKLN
jgi:hypothetical protein